MKKMLNVICIFVFILSISALLGACGSTESGEDNAIDSGTVSNIGEIPNTSVNFAMEPYPDHTDAIIAIEKEWFQDVGIDINTSMVDADKVSSVLIAGTADFASIPPVSLLPALKQEDFQGFVFGNLFKGYAIIAHPDDNYKSFEDFIQEGKSGDEAIQLVVEQMKGKIFTYPSETGVKPFIDLAFQKANMSLEDVITDVQQDSNGVSLMLSKRADFKVGGVPSRIKLEAEGMVPILTSEHIAQAAEPSGDSIEIRSLMHNGWVATKDWQEKNHDTILRIASVRFRLNQFLNDHKEEAAEIHIPYLNEQAGTDFTPEEGIVLYESQMPWYTFEQQEDWFENESDPLFWKYEIESNIKLYENEGLFDEGEFKPEDLISAHDIYEELKDLKEKTESNLEKLDDVSGDALELKNLAEKHYDIFNFLDSYRFSSQALEIINE